MTWPLSAQQVFAVLGPLFLVAAAWRFFGTRRNVLQARTWLIVGAIFGAVAVYLERLPEGAGRPHPAGANPPGQALPVRRPPTSGSLSAAGLAFPPIARMRSHFLGSGLALSAHSWPSPDDLRPFPHRPPRATIRVLASAPDLPMPDAVNAPAFAQPHWRVIAAGFDTERWFHDGQALGTGGIANPQPTRLPTGQYYYRFASSASPRQAQLGGGWWLDFENFTTVRRFADDHGYTVREAARLMLALPYAWTKVDLLIKALLREPLRAYTGPGKEARGSEAGADRGTRWIPTQHVAVRQLYLPGLCVPGPGRPLFETAFVQPAEVSTLR